MAGPCHTPHHLRFVCERRPASALACSERRFGSGVGAVVQPPVNAIMRQQLGMRPLLDDSPVIEDHDPVGPLDRGKAVRDQDRGAADHQPSQRFLHDRLGGIVERRGRLIEDQDARVFEDRPGDREPLALPAREARAALADDRVIPLGKLADEVVGIRLPRRRLDLLAGRLLTTVGDILRHRAAEKDQAPAAPRRARRGAS